ncbi:hypothetical protein [Mycolicibacter hiberniae]|uniref:Uncharacterized protein n=1 Tax=Mycolicibacter hiberniae TaxID=29314 RepID=A0A7I7X0B7_9MYCO|nr:hypothetical protein [Mycolicibacter hiberniae]MCV7085688.1 hypothetical protein [Mycolicibacter hiberniae]BBZ22700.1 hypothetical protein MHIB_11180 [Mycolicibacter hiberniae]
MAPVLVALIIAYVMVKRWADKPTPVGTPEQEQARANLKKLGDELNSVLLAWLTLLTGFVILGLALNGALVPLLVYGVLPMVAAVCAVRLGLRAAHERATERNRLIADATKQHNQVMAGDDSGIYGRYPPAAC